MSDVDSLGYVGTPEEKAALAHRDYWEMVVESFKR